MKEPIISYNELMKEVNKLKIKAGKEGKEKGLTKEQRKFILKCRKEPKILFNDIAKLWNAMPGWRKLGRRRIAELHQGLMEDEISKGS